MNSPFGPAGDEHQAEAAYNEFLSRADDLRKAGCAYGDLAADMMQSMLSISRHASRTGRSDIGDILVQDLMDCLADFAVRVTTDPASVRGHGTP